MKNKMECKKRFYATAMMVFLIFSMILVSIPIANAAGAITLTPAIQAPGSSVTVSGTGFGANQAVGIGFGAEVNVTNESMIITGPFDVANGPYVGYSSYAPIKPGTFTLSANVSATFFIKADIDFGNGTLGSATPLFINGTINYVTGQRTRFLNSPVSSANRILHLVNYTRYQYNVTPAAGVRTNALGNFQATITVPNVADGVYNVTVVDAQGNTATTTLTVARGVMKLSSSVRASGASITVSGTGFGANQAVGIGFGKEVNVINETLAESGPYGVAGGPYYYHVSHVPVKPGTYRKAINISTTSWWAADVDMGNGRFNSTSATMVNGTINYVTGLITLHMGAPIPLTTHYINIANYTYYQYDVTPAAGVTTSASGAFSASITVPNVGDGVYAVTAVDAQGHIATATLTVANTGGGWDQTYGGAGDEQGQGDTLQTSDGGYAILGNTTSFGAGGSDFYLIKTDADGDKIWSKTYGGTLDEFAGGMCKTNDGGYALCGSTNSFGVGGRDFWLIKTNANGDIKWSNTFGGDGNDVATSVVQTSDGGYAVGGRTDSYDVGQGDLWLVKTDANGNMQWSKTYGGAGHESSFMIQASGGGYVLVADTNSSGAGREDIWLVKTDANGNMQWNKTYGGTGTDEAYSVVATSDGGYALGGYTTSFGMWKPYLVKTDASGNMQWNKTYGTTVVDIGVYLIKTMDGGYAIAGWSYEGTGFTDQNFLLIKTDASGNFEWKKTYGGPGLENCYSLLQASDGGYVLTGETSSSGVGGSDLYVVKTNAAGVVPEGLTIGVMVLISSIVMIACIRYFRKRQKIESFSQVKL